MSLLLRTRQLSVRFGGLCALDGVELELGAGEILGLIGPNGAGKTTLLNVLSGFQRPTVGEVELDGRTITRWDAPRRARAGISRTFQDVRLFEEMSVQENCEVAVVGCGGRRSTARTQATQALELLDLQGSAHVLARDLPYGLQRRVGLARALCARPRVLLLDEPAAGLNDDESAAMAETVRAIHAELGCGVVVIEHDVRMILGLSHRVHVLDHGVTLRVGSPDEIRTDPDVVTAYLGEEVHA
ncbi:ABC transporter ATP-binding protein [Nocardioides marmoriginsengisoli]|uniref:ABC transporter ATP-binding protein n=1 Tax=Nocardioides marmoriginsengisoli TaxID=661483 RepID=A0A3N0CHT3_9ACTN|nr:ABC transporter ATP-binding protein [Nocardioides marmoriginsengisoli]RNL62606.1 ABC transporter ATP-binding protein [Nocardioides marmoriginsengisoli]